MYLSAFPSDQRYCFRVRNNEHSCHCHKAQLWEDCVVNYGIFFVFPFFIFHVSVIDMLDFA